MLDQARQRMAQFQTRLKDAGIDVAVMTDESSIAYLAGFWGYLSVEFGRPTFLLVRPDEPPVVVTPLMESEMVSAMTWVEDILTWEDAGANRWENVLAEALGDKPGRIGVEPRPCRHRAQLVRRTPAGHSASRHLHRARRHAHDQIARGNRGDAPGRQDRRRHDGQRPRARWPRVRRSMKQPLP